MKHFQMFTLTSLIFPLLSAPAISAERACDEVIGVLNQSSYLEHRDHDGNALGYVHFDNTPVGKWMLYDNGQTTTAKSDPGTLVGRAGVKSAGDDCVLTVLGRTGPLLHKVMAKDENTIEFVADEKNNDVFFQPSLLVPVTDEGDLDLLTNRFHPKR